MATANAPDLMKAGQSREDYYRLCASQDLELPTPLVGDHNSTRRKTLFSVDKSVSDSSGTSFQERLRHDSFTDHAHQFKTHEEYTNKRRELKKVIASLMKENVPLEEHITAERERMTAEIEQLKSLELDQSNREPISTKRMEIASSIRRRHTSTPDVSNITREGYRPGLEVPVLLNAIPKLPVHKPPRTTSVNRPVLTSLIPRPNLLHKPPHRPNVTRRNFDDFDQDVNRHKEYTLFQPNQRPGTDLPQGQDNHRQVHNNINNTIPEYDEYTVIDDTSDLEIINPPPHHTYVAPTHDRQNIPLVEQRAVHNTEPNFVRFTQPGTHTRTPPNTNHLRPLPKPVAMPDSYFGTDKDNWSEWLLEFDLYGEVNGWSESDKLRFLPICLKGIARKTLLDIPGALRVTYSAAISELSNRFTPICNSELFKVKLRDRKRKKNENLSDLALEIRSLARKAYPNRDHAFLQEVCCEQFIEAQYERASRIKLRRSKLYTIDSMAAFLTDYESFELIEDSRSRPTPETPYVTPRNTRKLTCFGCGKEGHRVDQCTKSRRSNNISINSTNADNRFTPNNDTRRFQNNYMEPNYHTTYNGYSHNNDIDFRTPPTYPNNYPPMNTQQYYNNDTFNTQYTPYNNAIHQPYTSYQYGQQGNIQDMPYNAQSTNNTYNSYSSYNPYQSGHPGDLRLNELNINPQQAPRYNQPPIQDAAHTPVTQHNTQPNDRSIPNASAKTPTSHLNDRQW
jgi:hypothetical protein